MICTRNLATSILFHLLGASSFVGRGAGEIAVAALGTATRVVTEAKFSSRTFGLTIVLPSSRSCASGLLLLSSSLLLVLSAFVLDSSDSELDVVGGDDLSEFESATDESPP